MVEAGFWKRCFIEKEQKDVHLSVILRLEQESATKNHKHLNHELHLHLRDMANPVALIAAIDRFLDRFCRIHG